MKVYENDLGIFNVPKLVLIKLDTAELYVVDSVSFGFGSPDSGNPIDVTKVITNGFEILGEL